MKRNSRPVNYITAIDDKTYAIRITGDGEVTLNDEPRPLNLESIEGDRVYSLLLGTRSYEVLVERAGDEYTITLDGDRFTVQVADERQARSGRKSGRTYGQRSASAASGGASGGAGAEPGAVVSPMIGVLLEVLVKEGQTVEAGDRVALLEAMKTENVIRAPHGGTVRDIQVTAGQTLRMDAVILYIDEPQG